jgi:MYXO-CTERM domain-containing protein
MCVAAGLAFAANVKADPTVRITKGPYLQDLASTSVEIRAELDTASPASITIAPRGTDAGVARTIRDAQASTMHVIHIDGLSPSTHYSYSLEAGRASAIGELTTAPPNESTDPFTFLVYGDNRSDDVAHAAVVHQMMQSPSDFVVHTGDFVQDGAVGAFWQTFFDVESPLIRDRCVYACVGNHEIIDGAGANYLRYFGPVSDAHGDGEKPKLYGSFRWGNARFFLLDAMESFDDGPERAWLDDELSRADAEKLAWRIVVLHHGPWSAGPHGGNRRVISAGIPALLKKHHVDLILAGHDHIYERGFASGLPYVISGGGGAPLYPIDHPLSSTRRMESVHHFIEMNVSTDAIRMVAKRDDGSVLDRCGLLRASDTWDCDPAPSPATASPRPAAPSPDPVPPVASKCACGIVGGEEGAGPPRGPLAVVALFALAFVRRRRLGYAHHE